MTGFRTPTMVGDEASEAAAIARRGFPGCTSPTLRATVVLWAGTAQQHPGRRERERPSYPQHPPCWSRSPATAGTRSFTVIRDNRRFLIVDVPRVGLRDDPRWPPPRRRPQPAPCSRARAAPAPVRRQGLAARPTLTHSRKIEWPDSSCTFGGRPAGRAACRTAGSARGPAACAHDRRSLGRDPTGTHPNDRGCTEIRVARADLLPRSCAHLRMGNTGAGGVAGS